MWDATNYQFFLPLVLKRAIERELANSQASRACTLCMILTKKPLLSSIDYYLLFYMIFKPSLPFTEYDVYVCCVPDADVC